MRKKKIVFLSSKDPRSIKAWSGIPFFMLKALKEYFEVEIVQLPEFKKLRLIGYYVSRVWYAITRKKYLFDYGLLISWLYGIHASRQLRKHSGIDFIFCPAGLSDIAFLNTNVPVITCGDCSMLQLMDYYPALSNVSLVSRLEITRVEARAFRKAQINILSSRWASAFIATHYNPSCVLTIPFGANLESLTLPKSVRRFSDQCNLIFVGVDWIRKGGAEALAIRDAVERSGISCNLLVIGSQPADVNEVNENVTFVRSLDKSTESVAYAEYFDRSHFMILPAIADCTPIVIAESFAFGVPVVAHNTGGIGSMITNGLNGFLMEGRNPDDYARIIMDNLSDATQYETMVNACYRSYETRYNWNKWAADLYSEIENRKTRA